MHFSLGCSVAASWRRLIPICWVAVTIFLTRSAVAQKDKPAGNFRISGYVGTSAASPAVGITVVLINKATGAMVDSATTNLSGRFRFRRVAPGFYLVRVDRVTRDVTLINRDVRLDIDLSAPGGVMDYRKRPPEVKKEPTASGKNKSRD